MHCNQAWLEVPRWLFLEGDFAEVCLVIECGYSTLLPGRSDGAMPRVMSVLHRNCELPRELVGLDLDCRDGKRRGLA